MDVKEGAKMATLERVEKMLTEKGFDIVAKDFDRPWGGFFVINEEQAREFIEAFYIGSRFASLAGVQKISPKFLVVEPGMRLSWQYHNRRSEVWRVYEGVVGVVRSATDEQSEPVEVQEGEQVVIALGQRHRLVGMDDYGIVAEIWQHSISDEPSDEADIVRLEDDFGRN